jgi:hypothetical protein
MLLHALVDMFQLTSRRVMVFRIGDMVRIIRTKTAKSRDDVCEMIRQQLNISTHDATRPDTVRTKGQGRPFLLFGTP